MFYLQSPHDNMDELGIPMWKYPSVFLAGGISGCDNWQHDFAMRFKDDDFIIVNPRRVGDLAKDGDGAAEQIRWEHYYLNKVELVSFWFTPSTIQPITLFELGKISGRRHNNQMFAVGAHPDYERLFDLKHQLYPTIVRDSLDALEKRIRHLITGWQELQRCLRANHT